MSHRPTGRLECGTSAPSLIFERQLPAAIGVVWNALTRPEETARWIGRWDGEAAPEKSIDVVWLFEEGAPVERVRILTCDPPRRLALAAGPDPDAPWLVTIELVESAEGTVLEFRQLMANGLSPALVGTGWEFYLDRLTAVLAGGDDLPVWDDRYQQMQSHYEELQAAMALCEE